MNQAPGRFWTSTRGMAALALIAAVSYFLFVEHRQHLLPALPYLILLSCPLMHIFMHRAHGPDRKDADKRPHSEGDDPHAH
jgi:Protein of unknown function (DUF2933)